MIQPKLKICYGCELPKIIWKNKDGHKYCKFCFFRLFPGTSALRTKSVSTIKSTKPIAKISKNRIEALKIYRRKRDKFFEENPVCMFPGCSSRKITLHHGRGRVGSFLTDKRWFKSLCWPHHKYCEENPSEAIKLNLSYKRLDNDH